MLDLTTRRGILQIAAAGTAAASAIAFSATTAQAYQGNMERALSSLQAALRSLRDATPNKGGHREAAIQMIEQAIGQVGEGIRFANQHGGG